jgi:biotin-dependent carboxylase-like uncharacterized protein
VSALEVLDAGLLTTVQDLGRRGYAHFGVARSGAADRTSLRLGNRLAGNDAAAAGLEILGGGATFRADGRIVVAVTGSCGGVVVNGSREGRNVALRLEPGDVLRLEAATRGLRGYLAVRGGLDVPAVLGSRCYDQPGGLGPPPLTAGDVVSIGVEPDRPAYWDVVPVRELDLDPTLRVVAGPRDSWLHSPGLEQLTGNPWTVLPMSDRSGLRLSGPPLTRRRDDPPSEGVVPGAVQVPTDGMPIVLGPDTGVTGGYPVVAVVVDADLDTVGQLGPGARVRFRLIR